jgi:hypothetical protein
MSINHYVFRMTAAQRLTWFQRLRDHYAERRHDAKSRRFVAWYRNINMTWLIDYRFAA